MSEDESLDNEEVEAAATAVQSECEESSNIKSVENEEVDGISTSENSDDDTDGFWKTVICSDLSFYFIF